MAHNADRQFAEFVIFAVGQSLRRGNHNRFARVDTERVEVFHVADRDAVVEAVAHHFILHFFPAFQALFDQDLRRERESLLGQFVEFGFVVAKARTESAERVGRADNHGIAQRFCGAARVFQRFHGLTLDRFDVDLVQFLDKQLAVFRVHDGLHGRAEHLEVILLQYAAAVEFNTAVQRRLSTERQHNTLRAFFFYHALDEIRSDGQEINTVGHAFRSLHRGNVRIDEHCFDALLFECFQRLATRIIELTGFADLQSARTEQQNFLNVRINHASDYLRRLTKSSKRNSVSTGPLQASGWNCAENHGFVL